MTNRPPSIVGGFDEAKLTSLACLVSLRAKGHQVSNEDHTPLEEDEVEDTISEADTEHPACIARSNREELKKRFLDRLAEIVSYRKGGPHVASTALVENRHSVSVYIAKNDGFSEAEREELKGIFHAISNLKSGLLS